MGGKVMGTTRERGEMTDGAAVEEHIFVPVSGGVFLWCSVCGFVTTGQQQCVLCCDCCWAGEKTGRRC